MGRPITRAGFRWTRGDASNEALGLAVDDTSKALHIAEAADIGTDWNVAADSHPTLYLHSATTPATDYLKVYHDATIAYVDVVGGTTLRLLIAGTAEIDLTASAFSPAVTDSNALGTTALMWSDLFLASGAVVNFDNGNFTITHSAGRLALAGSPAATVDMLRIISTVSAPNNQEGMSAYFQADISGTTAGHCYGLGSWINTTGTVTLSAGNIITPFEGGVYTGEAQANARIVFGGQFQAILNGAPATLYAFRLNTNRTITALIAAANNGSVAYTASTATSSSKVGDVAIFDIAGGVGVRYIRLYDAAG